jgi:hypothetical protein
VNYGKNFNNSNVSIGNLRADICENCEKFQIQILILQKEIKFHSIDEIKKNLELHQNEANILRFETQLEMTTFERQNSSPFLL